MRKWSICSIAVILTILTANKATGQSVTLLKTTYLPHYPSASGIAFYQNKLYIIGDDAQKLMVLNTNHDLIDSVTFFKHEVKRIPYQIKPDLESLTTVQYKGNDFLVALPSFSTEQRNRIYIFPLNNIADFKMISNANTIQLLKKFGIKEPNLEGSTKVNNNLLVSNRAHQAQPINYLVSIPVKKRFLLKSKRWKKTKLQFLDTTSTVGVSGLEYIIASDQLFITASTEATSSTNQDGAIGESFFGYISEFSKQSGNDNITVNKLFNLSKLLRIGNQKIEGVCIESNNNETAILHLVADNDDGQSIIYKVQLKY